MDSLKKHWKKILIAALLTISAILAGNTDTRTAVLNLIKEVNSIVTTTQPN